MELPLELVVVDAASLTAEVNRLVPLLASTHAAPWAVRVSSLKRIAGLQRDPIAAAQSNFASEMWRLRAGIVEQLTDRRSLVVKQACESISALSARFRDTFINAEPTESVVQAQTMWLDLTAFFIDYLLPLIPITVQVINSSACLCLNTIIKQVAPVYRGGKFRLSHHPPSPFHRHHPQAWDRSRSLVPRCSELHCQDGPAVCEARERDGSGGDCQTRCSRCSGRPEAR